MIVRPCDDNATAPDAWSKRFQCSFFCLFFCSNNEMFEIVRCASVEYIRVRVHACILHSRRWSIVGKMLSCVARYWLQYVLSPVYLLTGIRVCAHIQRQEVFAAKHNTHHIKCSKKMFLQNNLHCLPVRWNGEGLRACSLPRRVRERGAGYEDRPQWEQGAGLVPKQESQVA